jgi:pimeloyl-ACP methyl ester carboxylesterase
MSDWDETFVRAEDGTRLYTRTRAGEGPVTAILCDGIACDGFIWRFLVDDLRPIARVVHWNYRGHGRSAAPVDPERIDIDAFVSDLNAVRDALAPGPVVLAGHSMGCQLALEGYRNRPENVVGIILFCGTPGRMTHTFKGSDGLARALPGFINWVEKSPRLARAVWSNVPPNVSMRIAMATGEVDASAIEPDDIVRYSEHVANLDLWMFLRMLRSIGDATAEDMLPTIDPPVLVVAGELDTFTPVHLAEKMAAEIPNSDLVIESGATHVVPIERRDAIRAHVEKFMRERVFPRVD